MQWLRGVLPDAAVPPGDGVVGLSHGGVPGVALARGRVALHLRRY